LKRKLDHNCCRFIFILRNLIKIMLKLVLFIHCN